MIKINALHREWQFDGLVGPTHNYAGLATGNNASAFHAGRVSNPRLAALQGIKKMLYIKSLGFDQGFFPPHYRPMLGQLKQLGFRGNRAKIIEQAASTAPELLASVFSSSFMWAANAATVTQSDTTKNRKLILTPANLLSHFHRAIETKNTSVILKRIFHNSRLFNINYALPNAINFADEGDANKMIIINNSGSILSEIFVYGKSHLETLEKISFNSRQSAEASQALSRVNQLDAHECLFLQQSPSVIELGVFHNDVIAMSSNQCMIVHESAYIPEHQALLKNIVQMDPSLRWREVRSDELSVEEAVTTYLFNSQLLKNDQGDYILVAPIECEEHPRAKRLIEQFLDEGLIKECHYLDVRESMQNGGGPACLRLRVPMTREESGAIHPGVIVTDEKAQALIGWVNTHYRDRLSFDDFRDPTLIDELDRAYSALEKIIDMPGLYRELECAI